MAREVGGKFLLRIDDLDQSRARPEWEQKIYDDLTWLGLSWDGPVRRQSEHLGEYATALAHLRDLGLTFECTCSRRDIIAASNAPQEGAPLFGPDGRIYPGTCRAQNHPEKSATCTRLNIQRAAELGLPASFQETGPKYAGSYPLTADDLIQTIGDVVLGRRNMTASYHLSVVLDDVATGVTQVIRGEDLFEATRIHVLLQSLLNVPTPSYHHHSLIRDPQGKRLAKRDDARALSKYRNEGATPADIRNFVGL